MNAILKTQAGVYRKARSSNATDSAFASKVPTSTKPSGTGVITLMTNVPGQPIPNLIEVCAYAVANNNDTFNFRVIGWKQLGSDPNTSLWVPRTLAEIACTVGTAAVAASGKDLLTTELFADTMSLTVGNANVTVNIVSPADNTIAYASIDIQASPIVEIIFDDGTGGSGGMNALYDLY